MDKIKIFLLKKLLILCRYNNTLYFSKIYIFSSYYVLYENLLLYKLGNISLFIDNYYKWINCYFVMYSYIILFIIDNRK